VSRSPSYNQRLMEWKKARTNQRLILGSASGTVNP